MRRQTQRGFCTAPKLAVISNSGNQVQETQVQKTQVQGTKISENKSQHEAKDGISNQGIRKN